MTILSASLLSKTGRVLLARQFVDLTRARTEGLLAAFPKLLTGDSECTFIETDSVRYIYQPLDTVYIVLITTKHSNILEDMDLLHILAKLIPEYCMEINERSIEEHAFDLTFAFDEVLCLGLKEKVTPSQVRKFCEMESEWEKLADLVEKNKEREALEQAKKKQQEIEQKRKAGGLPNAMGGGSMGGSDVSQRSAYQTTQPYITSAPSAVSQPAASSTTLQKGMSLKKVAKDDKYIKALEEEGAIAPVESGVNLSSTPPQFSTPQESIHFTCDETLNFSIDKDGELLKGSSRGELIVRLTDPNQAVCSILVHNPKSLQTRTHPNLDKASWSKQNILRAKNASQPLPLNKSFPLLKWKVDFSNDDDIPMLVNCWPSPESADSTSISMDYELKRTDLVLKNVLISIPIPCRNMPVVHNIDGESNYDSRNAILQWRIAHMDSENATGNLEFSTGLVDDNNTLYPISIKFSSPNTVSGLRVEKVFATNDETLFTHSIDTNLKIEKYDIQAPEDFDADF